MFMKNITVKNLPDNILQQFKALAKKHHRSLNNEIILHLKKCLQLIDKKSEWPASILKFRGIKDFPSFEKNRKKLKTAKKDFNK